jgi:hypothetical protein
VSEVLSFENRHGEVSEDLVSKHSQKTCLDVKSRVRGDKSRS